MRRHPSIVIAALAACSASIAAPAGALGSPEASARLVACHPALRPGERSLIVEAAMRAQGPGERMQIRFDLYRRVGTRGTFMRVPGPGLGIYNRALPGVGAYRFRKRIQNLFAAGDYRVEVGFRWLAADGAVVASLVRSPPVCRQPELRADLEVTRLELESGPDPDHATYELTVRNAGGSPAGGFAVGLWVAGQPQASTGVSGLGPGEARTLTIVAARCPAGETAHATADPDRRLPDADRMNNVRGLRCPAAQPAGRG